MSDDRSLHVEGIQLDYGGYDDRFPGIFLRANSIREAQLTLAGLCRDFREIEIHHQLLHGASRHERFNFLATVTAHLHELRHIGQFSVSPLHAFLHRQRMRQICSFERIKLAPARSSRHRLAPSPMLRWMQLPYGERNSLISSLILDAPQVNDMSITAFGRDLWSGFTEYNPYKNPMFDRKKGRKYERALFESSNNLRYFLSGDGWIRNYVGIGGEHGHLTSDRVVIAELDALLSQARYIKENFGKDDAILFLEVIMEIASTSVYGLGLFLICVNCRISIPEIVTNLDLIERIVSYCWFGDLEGTGVAPGLLKAFIDDRESFRQFGPVHLTDPISRLNSLAFVLMTEGLAQFRGMSGLELFDKLDEIRSVSGQKYSWRRGLAASAARDHEFLNELIKLVGIGWRRYFGAPEGAQKLPSHRQVAVSCMRAMFIRSHFSASIADEVLKDPDAYANSSRYFDERKTWIRPNIWIGFRGGMEDVPEFVSLVKNSAFGADAEWLDYDTARWHGGVPSNEMKFGGCVDVIVREESAELPFLSAAEASDLLFRFDAVEEAMLGSRSKSFLPAMWDETRHRLKSARLRGCYTVRPWMDEGIDPWRAWWRKEEAARLNRQM